MTWKMEPISLMTIQLKIIDTVSAALISPVESIFYQKKKKQQPNRMDSINKPINWLKNQPQCHRNEIAVVQNQIWSSRVIDNIL